MKDNIFIHPSSEVKTPNIGKGTRIWQYTVVMENVVIGERCNIGAHCFIENGVIIDKEVTVKNGVQLWNGVILEDKVFIGPNVTFTNDIYPRSKVYYEEYKKTVIKKGASIGANSTIIAGVTIGEFALIGAGSVVTKNVPAYTLYYGVPAIFKAYICVCGTKLLFENKKKLFCPKCGKKFLKTEKGEIIPITKISGG